MFFFRNQCSESHVAAVSSASQGGLSWDEQRRIEDRSPGRKGSSGRRGHAAIRRKKYGDFERDIWR